MFIKNYYDTVYVFKTEFDFVKILPKMIPFNDYIIKHNDPKYVPDIIDPYTNCQSHRLRFQYDFFDSFPECSSVKKELIDAFLSIRPVKGTYYIHTFLNIYFENEFIKWHDHIGSYFGFMYLNVEGSTTSIKFTKIEAEELIIQGERGLFAIATCPGTPHRSSIWKGKEPRVTVAYNFLNLETHGGRIYYNMLRNDIKEKLIRIEI